MWYNYLIVNTVSWIFIIQYILYHLYYEYIHIYSIIYNLWYMEYEKWNIIYNIQFIIENIIYLKSTYRLLKK